MTQLEGPGVTRPLRVSWMKNWETAASLPLEHGGGGAWTVMGEGIPEAKHSFPAASSPLPVCTGPFPGAESAPPE